MSGRYVPPHKRAAIAAKQQQELASLSSSSTAGGSVPEPPPEDLPFQEAMWDALRRTLTGIVNRISIGNITTVCVEVFRENIIRGRGLLCTALLRTQQADSDLTPVFAAFVAVINKEFPVIGALLLRRLLCHWKRYYRRRNWSAVANVNRFISQLFCFHVVDEDIVQEIILAHLLNPKRSDDDVDMAALTFEEIFKVLLERNPRDFHANLLEPFRESLLAEDPGQQLSRRAQTVIEAALKKVQDWEQRRVKTAAIPSELCLVPSGDQTTHHVELDADYPEDVQLDAFHYDAKFQEHEDQYEMSRRAILGENWEEELLAAAERDDEEVAGVDEDEAAGSDSKAEAERKINAITSQEEERRIKSEVYLIIRSSLRADEIAHKLLKHLEPKTERMVCAMVLDTCCEESTYKKIYALVAERLCKTYSTMQLMYVSVLHGKYEKADALSERQIDHVGQFWAHLLRTDALRWGSLSCMNILTEDTSQRLVIQAVLQSLTRTMGMSTVVKKLHADKELTPQLRGLFPVHTNDLSQLQLAVDLFESMQVGPLAADMRSRFEQLRIIRKRERTEDE